ncbi:MAG: SRPBCC family protein [Bacteroidetes bacterium]|nr:SRPBCC family protein [Bacteroidota bacterium]
MKALKTIGLVVLIIIALIIIISLFLPRKVHVERSLVINANQEVVFDQVNTLKNWENWSPWHKIDTAMEVFYCGPFTGVGAVYNWRSKNPDVGNGSMNIVKSILYDTVVLNLDFTHSTAISTFYFVPEGDGVKVIWGIDANMGRNPLKRYLGMFMDKWIAPDFEKGLQTMKQYVEKLPCAHMKAEVSAFADATYLSIRDTSCMATISSKMGAQFGELMGFLQGKKLNPSGPPFSIYYAWEGDKFDIENCIPLEKQVPGEGRILSGSLKGSKAVKVNYYGKYDFTYWGHEVAENYIKKNNLRITGKPMEVYMTDPMSEKDTNKWLTVIVWPVE